jgi:hypothetical protein
MAWLPLVVAIAMGHDGAPLDKPIHRSAQSQSQVPGRDEPVRVEDVEVFGRRGAALLPPEAELDAANIDALGAWSIDDVLGRMEDTLGLGDQPMVLINGQPTPNLSAYTGFPPEALARAEVLPSEAGGVYGAKPGQRVVNLVLQPQFSSYDGRLIGSRPTQGGTSSVSGDLRRSAISGRNTHQIGLRVARDTSLRANERDQYLTAGGPVGELVTLRPRSDSAFANISVTRALGDWSGVFGLNAQTQDSRAVIRIDDENVETRRTSEALSASAGFSGQLAGWSLQTNLNGRAAQSREDGIQDLRNNTHSFSLSGSARRRLIDLPSGAVTANLNGNLMASRSEGERDAQQIDNSFHSADARASLAFPLSKAGGASLVGRVMGDLAATLGAGARQSGGGSGEEVNAGLSWAPRQGVRLNGEWSVSSDGVPDVLRTEPEYFGPPVVVFDFRTGEAVEVLPIRGGNPDLTPPESQRLSLTASLGPFTSWAVSGNLSYQRSQSSDGIGYLPGLTQDVEAAFPERIRRDADGRLISIDYRPMNLSTTLVDSLNTGLNFNLPRARGTSGADATVLRIALNHSFQLANAVRLRAGLSELDRLKGDGGGLSRQNARLMLDARRGRWGANASAQWQAGYRTRRTAGADRPGDLIMASFKTLDLRFSFQMTSSRPRSETGDGSSRRGSGGLQLNLDIENLFDERREARLGDGSPAAGYARDVQDPIGRTVRLTLQRRF